MSAIQWTEHTNPGGIRGCSPASEGCANCYAQAMANRLIEMGDKKGYTPDLIRISGKGKNAKAVWSGVVRSNIVLMEQDLARLPKKKPTMVFPSMVDPFHPKVPFRHLDHLFLWFVMNPHLTLQLLTKRPDRMAEFDEMLRKRGASWPDNIWAGTSCENQKWFNRRIIHLHALRAKVKFLSLEPLLGPLDVEWPDEVNPAKYCCDGRECGCRGLPVDPPLVHGINWVIVGGESGPRARRCNVDWIMSVVRQCREWSVPVFVKQLGAFPMVDDSTVLRLQDSKGGNMDEWPEDLRVREMPAVIDTEPAQGSLL